MAAYVARLVLLLLLGGQAALGLQPSRCPAALSSSATGESCDARLAFVVFGSGRGSDSSSRHRDALLAAHTLGANGLWRGLVVVPSACSAAPLPSAEGGGGADVRVVARPQYGAGGGPAGVASQAARVAEAFRLLPSTVELVRVSLCECVNVCVCVCTCCRGRMAGRKGRHRVRSTFVGCSCAVLSSVARRLRSLPLFLSAPFFRAALLRSKHTQQLDFIGRGKAEQKH